MEQDNEKIIYDIEVRTKIDEAQQELRKLKQELKTNNKEELLVNLKFVGSENFSSIKQNLNEVRKAIEVLEKQFPGKGEEYAKKLKDCTIALYKKCADYALSKGIIIADTKFEFGLDEEGNIVLGDEMLTPDSSRFWPAEGYEPGHSQPSFDKQFARDWLTSHPGNDWTLPEEIVQKTIDKYLQSYKMLTGKEL